MRQRTGPFWDGVQGRAPIPPAAATLGFELVDADVEAGTIEVAFTATERFTNPSGNVLGAFVAAMLYDTVGPALLATLGPDKFQSTLQLGVSFLRPVRPGRVTGRGQQEKLSFASPGSPDRRGEPAGQSVKSSKSS